MYFVWFARPALIIQRRLFYGTSFIATCVHDSPQLCWGFGIVSISHNSRHRQKIRSVHRFFCMSCNRLCAYPHYLNDRHNTFFCEHNHFLHLCIIQTSTTILYFTAALYHLCIIFASFLHYATVLISIPYMLQTYPLHPVRSSYCFHYSCPPVPDHI